MSKKRWTQIQQQEYEAGQEKLKQTGSYFGYFSVPEFYVTDQIADRLANVDGPVLDIGCGLLPMPNYLKKARQPFGVDPYLGEARVFPFCQSTGEALPFGDGYFAAVLFMSSLDHMINPQAAIDEAVRVLRAGGLMFVWYANRAKPDEHHEWAIDRGIISKMTKWLLDIDYVIYKGDRGVGFPRTEMVVLKK